MNTAELLAELDRTPEGDTVARLAAIRGVAAADGVRVEVDVHGALVGLHVAEPAMRQPAHRLADRITTLAAQATRAAMAQALALLHWAGGPELAELLTPARTPRPLAQDTFEPTSWAI